MHAWLAGAKQVARDKIFLGIANQQAKQMERK